MDGDQLRNILKENNFYLENNKIIYYILNIFLLAQLFLLIHDFRLFNFIDGSRSYSSAISIILLLSLFLLDKIFRRNSIFFFISIIIFLEMMGNYILKGRLHVGYVTHLLTLLVLIFEISKSSVKSKIILFLKKILTIRTVIIYAIILYFIVYLFFDGFKTQNLKSVLGDSIQTWVLGGWDQSAYYRMVLKIIDGKWFFGGFNGGYYYPIGYPLLGALGNFFYKTNPFFIINLSCYVIIIYFVFKILKEHTNIFLAFIAITFIGLQSPMISIDDQFMRSMIFPYNNVISISASAMTLYYLFINRKIKIYELLILGIIIGWVLVSRYGDVIFFIIPLLYFSIFKSEKKHIHSLLIAFSPMLIFFIFILFLNHIFYGNMLTTYYSFSGKHKYWFHPFAFDVHFFRFLEVFLFPFISSNRKLASFLLPMSYVIFIPYGIYYLIRIKKYYYETIIALLFIISNILYFTSTDAATGLQIIYDCFRYFSVSIPFLVFFSFLGIYFTTFHFRKQIHKYKNIFFFIIFVSLISLKPISAFFHNLATYNYSIKFIGIGDKVARKPYPNYGKDGFPDYIFKIKIDSLFPVYLKNISVISPHGGMFVSENINKKDKNNLWGVGIINEYGKQVKLKWGDNFYKNNFIDYKKEITIILPVPTEGLVGKYEFILTTSKGQKKRPFYLDEKILGQYR